MAADADILQLISQVKVEGNFDQPDDVILNWLSRRHLTMCARSKCYREYAANPAVPATFVPIPIDTLNDIDPGTAQTGVVEVISVAIDGLPWRKVEWEIYEKAVAGVARLSGAGGIWTEGMAPSPLDPSKNFESLYLYPVPTEDFALSLTEALLPLPLTLDDRSADPTVQTQLKIPLQFYDGLVAGAIATGLSRTEQRPDLARPMADEFDAACEELRVHVKRKYRGTGPVTIRVEGYDA